MYTTMCRHVFVRANFLFNSQAQLTENLSTYLSFLVGFITEMLCTSGVPRVERLVGPTVCS